MKCSLNITTFVVRQISEKKRNLNWSFMDLQKAYGLVDRDAMWQTCLLYGIDARLLRMVYRYILMVRNALGRVAK